MVIGDGLSVTWVPGDYPVIHPRGRGFLGVGDIRARVDAPCFFFDGGGCDLIRPEGLRRRSGTGRNRKYGKSRRYSLGIMSAGPNGCG